MQINNYKGNNVQLQTINSQTQVASAQKAAVSAIVIIFSGLTHTHTHTAPHTHSHRMSCLKMLSPFGISLICAVGDGVGAVRVCGCTCVWLRMSNDNERHLQHHGVQIKATFRATTSVHTHYMRNYVITPANISSNSGNNNNNNITHCHASEWRVKPQLRAQQERRAVGCI